MILKEVNRQYFMCIWLTGYLNMGEIRNDE